VAGWKSSAAILPSAGPRRRRILAEVTEHLIDAADASASGRQAVDRFGSPVGLAGQFGRRRPRIALALLLWLLAAVAASVCAAMVYAAGQHVLRAGANDSQTQQAEDAAAQLAAGVAPSRVAAGPPVDLARSLAVTISVVDETGRVLASTGQLDGPPARPPLGTLRAAGAGGRNVVTWQPRPGVRQAAVISAYRGSDGAGTVVVTRSLRLVEQRETDLAQIVGLGWLFALAGAALAALLAARWWRPGGPAGPAVLAPAMT